jgi:hypothetical protein
VSESLVSVEKEMASLKSENNDNFSRINTDFDSTEDVLNARIDDLGDKLRLGMNKLQSAVGETQKSKGGQMDKTIIKN